MPEPSKRICLADQLAAGVLQCGMGPGFPIQAVNPAFLNLFGYSRQELTDQFEDHFSRLLHPRDLEMVLSALDGMSGGDVELEYRAYHKSGALMRILSQARLVRTDEGHCLCCVLMDITRRRESQEALRLSAERMQVIMDQTNDIIFEWDLLKDSILFSSNWKKRFGYSPIGGEAGSRLTASPNIHPDDHPVYLALLESIQSGTLYSESEFRILSLQNQYLWHRARATVQYDDSGRPVKAVGVLVDIDAEKHREQTLLDQAQRDALTGLFNKSAVQARTELLMEQWSEDTVQALLIIDLDDFKHINDEYGHLCGDAVLMDLATCLRRLFRATDNLGRIGGDEFMAYLPGLPNREVALYKAQAVLDALADMPLREGVGRGVSCSMGIAFYPADGADYAELFHCADLALYQAKCHGKHAWSVYDPVTCQSPSVANFARVTMDGVLEGEGEADDMDRRLAQYAFQLLYSAVSTQTAVQQILALTGRTYDVSRAYIFELNADGETCSNTFEWCNEGIPARQAGMKRVPLRNRAYDHLQAFDSDGIFHCRDIRQLLPMMRDHLRSMGVFSILQCAIRDEDQVLGFVGFDECRTENRCWTQGQTRALALIAGVLSTFLLKLRLKERVAELEQRPPESPKQ